MRGRTGNKLPYVVRFATFLSMPTFMADLIVAILIVIEMLAKFAAVVVVKFVAPRMCVPVSHGLTAKKQQH